MQIIGDPWPIGAVEVKVLTSQSHTYKLCRVWYVGRNVTRDEPLRKSAWEAKTPVVFSGFSDVARIFPEIRPTFPTLSSPPIPRPPRPNSRHFLKVPLLKVGLTVVSQSIFAVYEMTQPLKFLNSVGLLGSLTSSVYHYSAIKNQVCSTSDFSLQMTVFYRFLSHCFWPTKAPHIRVRTCEPCVQVATPLFSLLSPERSSLAVFAGVQDVVHPVFHVSIKWEAAIPVYRFVIRQRIESAFHLILINFFII